jgi:hypothetical protein
MIASSSRLQIQLSLLITREMYYVKTAEWNGISREITRSHCREGEGYKSYSPSGNRDYYTLAAIGDSTLINPDPERKANHK